MRFRLALVLCSQVWVNLIIMERTIKDEQKEAKMTNAIEFEIRNQDHSHDSECSFVEDTADTYLENDPIGAWWTDEK